MHLFWLVECGTTGFTKVLAKQLSHWLASYRWLRDGLEVRPEELSKPYKVVKRRGVKDAPQADPSGVKAEVEEGQEEPAVIPMPDAMVTKMYGRWQTQQWQVPTAVGGVVPKNDRGNVHCPPLASELPKVCHTIASVSFAHEIFYVEHQDVSGHHHKVLHDASAVLKDLLPVARHPAFTSPCFVVSSPESLCSSSSCKIRVLLGKLFATVSLMHRVRVIVRACIPKTSRLACCLLHYSTYNHYGIIFLYTMQGTVQLQMPRLGPICKKLGIDYAPAMTGFDIRGGRSVPVIEGVVICKEEEATVLEAYLEDERCLTS